MDVRCPECDRLYPDIDFSLAGSKFGCECGHKFFLDGRNIEETPEDRAESPSEEEAPAVEDLPRADDEPAAEAPATDLEEHEPYHGTALMDVDCPECGKVYVDIDATLAGSKFGCECGHKFFLKDNRGHAPVTADDYPGDSDSKSDSKPEKKDTGIVVKDPKNAGIIVGLDDDPEDDEDDFEDDYAPAPKRRRKKGAGVSGRKLFNYLLNLILVLLLVSLCYWGYLFLTGQAKSPFEIKLTPKEKPVEGPLEVEGLE